MGQVLGFELLRQELVRWRGTGKASVGTENQVGMLALHGLEPCTGQYLIDEVLEEIHRIKRGH